MLSEDVWIAVGGGIFTIASAIVAYVLRTIQRQFDNLARQVEASERTHTATGERMQRLEITDARHEERAQDIVRRMDDLHSIVQSTNEQTREQGVTLAIIAAKLDQALGGTDTNRRTLPSSHG